MAAWLNTPGALASVTRTSRGLREVGVRGLAGKHRGAGALENPGRELAAALGDAGIGSIARLGLGKIPGGAVLRRVGQAAVAQRRARELQRVLGFALGGPLPRAGQLVLECGELGGLEPEPAGLPHPQLLIGNVPPECPPA